MDEFSNHLVKWVPHLNRYARVLCRDSASSEDLVQETLAHAMERVQLFRYGLAGDGLRAWLFVMMHNIFVSGTRKPVHDQLDEDEPIQAPNSDPSRALLRRDILAAFAQLGESQRHVLLLVTIDGLSYADAAAVLNVPVGTIMSRVSRGRRRLAELLDIDLNLRDGSNMPMLAYSHG